ncbi:MAG: hypothetical protein M3Y03_02790, partial [Verrucomicrobiota bacterium]|nr:hypothetical protein [Verrucomicrobiota bacterium]
PSWFRLRRPVSLASELRWPALVALVVAAAIALYAFAVMPSLKRHEKIRVLATQINGALPTGAPLFAVDPDYQPFLFYVRDPIRYVDRVDEIPADAKYFLVQPKDEETALRSAQWEPRRARLILKLKDYRNKEVALMEIDGSPELSR